MEQFIPNKEKHLRWKNAIEQERKSGPHSLVIFTVKKYVKNFDNALILGDACQVNSKFLGDDAGFAHIDNVDSSPLVQDHYYDSEKMNAILSSFEAFKIPENSYDLIHGKSITFIEKDKLTEFLTQVKNGLKAGGIFSSIWNLPRSTIMPEANWDKTELEQMLKKTELEFIYEKEIEEDTVSLLNRKSHRHEWGIIMRKN